MPQVTQSVENNFTQGLKTEFTGLNFPENAATDADNVDFNLIGNVTRRPGIDFETDYATFTANRSGQAITTFKWPNAGGTGANDLFVLQVGTTLYFYKTSAVTASTPVSTHKLATTVSLTSFIPTGSANSPGPIECQYSTGNGYLFVYHPYCDPFYCTFIPDTVTTQVLTIKTRDFGGVYEYGFPIESRPFTLGPEHQYNLFNQGWTDTPAWDVTANTSVTIGASGARSWAVGTGLTITVGDLVNIYAGIPGATVLRQNKEYVLVMSGVVSGYTGGIVTINTFGCNDYYTGVTSGDWILKHLNYTRMTTWHGINGSIWPSNSDVLWYFKDNTGAFAPAQIANMSISTSQAPKGHFIMEEFNKDREVVGVVDGLLNTRTDIRPKTGAWFAGRAWYAGVDDSQPALASNPFYAWTENVYFSQLSLSGTDFDKCYQVNDPTDENLFDLLPTDGGTIKIQGCGKIYKLFPIQNGILAFASRGIWFITGSQGIGFTANDYTVTKISNIPSVSGTSFVNVQGVPMFWNEEGIYMVSQGQGGFSVDSLTYSTISTLYEEIPVPSKLFARGDYDPINMVVRWAYRDTVETNVTTRYQYNRFLNYNVRNKAFYTYTLTTAAPKVHGVDFILTSDATGVDSKFKYITSVVSGGSYVFSIAEDNPSITKDWDAYLGVGVADDFESYLVTGYRIKGAAIRKWKPLYVNVFSDSSDGAFSKYYVQGIWDYANTGNSGRFSSNQLVQVHSSTFDVVRHKLKIRGSGETLQLRISSEDNYPFNIIGWSIPEIINTGT